MSTTRVLRVLLLMSLLLAACGGEEHAQVKDTEDVVETVDGRTDAIWLRVNDHVDPAQWLASREAGRELGATEPAVGRIREAFVAARQHFIESHRMLANRTAQIGRMLAEEGRAEDYAGILYAFTDVAEAAGQRQTYGELCHHYYNLRHKNVSREDALRLLSQRYETQRQFR